MSKSEMSKMARRAAESDEYRAMLQAVRLVSKPYGTCVSVADSLRADGCRPGPVAYACACVPLQW